MNIRASNLCKDYSSGTERIQALRNVSLEIEPGEFLALAGPSGSGKSTLLNLLGGLDRPDEGKIFFGDQLVSEYSAQQLALLRLWHVGFIFQNFNLIPILNVLENVEYVMMLQGLPQAERKERSLAILADVGLKDYAGRKSNDLSGGQQQRVAVARAIVSRPNIVLADEPTANLDSKTAVALLDLMADLNRTHKITFLFSSHDPLVLHRAHRVLNLHDGELLD